MLTRPVASAVTGSHAYDDHAPLSGRTSECTVAVSSAGLNSQVVRVVRAGAASAGRAGGAVVSAAVTTRFEKCAPPKRPHRPTIPRVHGRFNEVTVSCGVAAPSRN